MTDDQDKTTPLDVPEVTETLPVPEPVASDGVTSAMPATPPPDEGDLPPKPAVRTADRRLLIVTGIAAVLAVLSLLLALMVFAPRVAPVKLGATSLAARAQEDEEILDVARRFSRNFLNHDYRSMDAFVDRVAADLSGSFREEFEQVNEFSASAFVRSKVVSKGTVKGAVLLYHEGSNARVQVLAERTTSNVNLKEPRKEDKVLNVFLVKTADGWKVENVGEPEQTGAVPTPRG